MVLLDDIARHAPPITADPNYQVPFPDMFPYDEFGTPETSNATFMPDQVGPNYGPALYSNGSPSYGGNDPIHDYLAAIAHARQDFTSRNDKVMHVLPLSFMGGVLGFTYLISNEMTLGDEQSIIPGTDLSQMVQVHEIGHTSDEYETRIRTDWKLTFIPSNYIL